VIKGGDGISSRYSQVPPHGYSLRERKSIDAWPGRQPLDADLIAAALKLVQAGLSPTVAARQRRDILANVVIARAFPEFFGMPIVMFQRQLRDFSQVLRIQFHVRSVSPLRGYPAQALVPASGVQSERSA
jgi:hypothetical protein